MRTRACHAGHAHPDTLSWIIEDAAKKLDHDFGLGLWHSACGLIDDDASASRCLL